MGNTLSPAAPASIADRPYSQKAKSSAQVSTLVAEPLRSGVSGHWVTVLLRPVRLRGEFGGVLHASIATRHFEGLFSRYELDGKHAVTLRNTTMQVIARRSPDSSSQGEVVDRVAGNPAS